MAYCGFARGFLDLWELPDLVPAIRRPARTQAVLDSEGNGAHICNDHRYMEEWMRHCFQDPLCSGNEPCVSLNVGCPCPNNATIVRQWGRDFDKMIRLTKNK